MIKPKISIISPVYKAEDIVDTLVDSIIAEISKITPDFEIILVEDCGKDGSWEKIIDNCNRNNKVKGIKLSRNYGQQHAIQAGMDNSAGEWVLTLDCDLQDSPKEIIKLFNKAQEGYDIVIAKRRNRQDNFIKRTASRLFYSLLGYLTNTVQDRSVANFVLYNMKVIKALALMKDYYRYYPMLIQLVGFKSIKVEVEHSEREIGKSSYSYRKRLNLALDTILTFSEKPLKLTVKAGVLLSLISIIATVVLFVLYIYSDVQVRGWATLVVLLCFFSGSIISVLGIVGLYVGKIFESVKGRPTYIIEDKIN